eukprot:TRINITY_DN7361_c0_g1_i2.p1 TRINITY_DN7361_c0_g1~~TRINITY_DN7361_c0_g1_i2.p1  ORF type:complete len:155 (-),score=24.94 TRINITY_DN7361_c0_g1_i2:19-483(-)
MQERIVFLTDFFAPLIADKARHQRNYETNPDDPEQQMLEMENGYMVSEIAEIVSQNFFFGFLSSVESAKMLESTPRGTFIIRFSSQKKFYCLDVKDKTQVRHWRIEKTGKLQFNLAGHSFPNFGLLIIFFQKRPLPTQPGAEPCCLAQPLTRTV